MSKINKISGFPEWLPGQKIIEDRVIERIKQIYASHGFTPIETPSVELMSTLASKGVMDKELYVLRRAQEEDGDREERLGLHFDLTAPFARYVAQHFSELTFPFKRYQLQRSWRGERPQKGRFREFYQFDVDVIAIDELPLCLDAEVLTVMEKAYSAINIGEHVVKINNRKILQGFYRSLGLDEAKRKKVITVVDKIDKIGRDGVLKELTSVENVEAHTARKIIELSEVKLSAAEAEQGLRKLGISDELYLQGAEELVQILSLVPESSRKQIQVNLSLARGLDYYTGLILEVALTKYPEFGSVGSGGRYDDLCGQFINKKLPGVGVSIGVTRLMDLIFTHNLIPVKEICPTKVLVSVYNEEQRLVCNVTAEKIRSCGIPTEVFHKSPKLGKQIDYATAKGIPYVLFINSESGAFEIKNLDTREQTAVTDLAGWCSGLKN